ncbi:MAG: helix-turn-helix domain-containing protein [Candidatus Nanopelagicales bacterium]
MSIGSMIAAARTEAGMSVEDLAAATRIRSTVLRAMEVDDFHLCGGDAYARGQIRSIANALGLDPAPFISAYDHPAGPPPEPEQRPGRRHARARAEEPVPRHPVPSPAATGPALAGLGRSTRESRGLQLNWTAAMVIALLAILAVGAVSVLTRGSGEEPVAAGSSSAAATPAPTVSEEPTPTPQPTTAEPTPSDAVAALPDDEVTLVLTVTGDKSWVSVTDSAGDTLYEGLATTGDVETFTDPERIRVVIGNAGAVELTVNGTDLGSPGGTGEVRRLEFTPGDPSDAVG